MTKLFLISLSFLIICGIILVLFLTLPKSNNSLSSAPASALRESFPSSSPSYVQVLSVQNLNDLAQNFVFDNPTGTGADPTGGSVNYSYFMDKVADATGKETITPNINGDIFWQNINLQNANVSNLWKDETTGGFTLLPSESLIDGGANVGSFRIGSKNFFKGGLFVFDMKALPAGCGSWPAIWLNGFQGAPNQYRFGANPVSDDNKAKMDRLYKEYQKTTMVNNIKFPKSDAVGSFQYQQRQCDPSQVLRTSDYDETNDGDNFALSGFDPYMSKYKGQKVFPAKWPAQGELDFVESVNFSDSSTTSFHTGPYCKPTGTVPFQNLKVDACGSTAEDAFGKYSGCKGPLYGYGDDGVDDGVTELVSGTYPDSICGPSPGTSQIIAPSGSFGTEFNKNKGGVFVCQWIPAVVVNVWFFARPKYTNEMLSQPGWPLSSSPSPSMRWIPALIANYNLTSSYRNTAGCDTNFMEIVINLTFGGNWAGLDSIFNASGCTLDGTQSKPGKAFSDFLSACYGDSSNTNCSVKGGADPYAQIPMTFSSIKVFQNPSTDEMI